MPLDRRAERLLAMLAATRSEAPEPPASRRAALVSLARMADDTTTPALVRDVAMPGPGGPLPLRVYSPTDAGAAPMPALVFFHGGGWVAGDFDTHDGLCRRLAAAAGCRVIAVGYRLAPEHPFPAAFDDALAATRWIATHAAELGVDAARLAVGGDSVGAGLAAAVAQAARDGGPALALQVLICPILDMARTAGSRAEFGDGYFLSRAAFTQDLAAYQAPPADPRVSPALAADLSRLPPAIVHTAEFDPFRDEGEAYAAHLSAAGIAATTLRHPGMIHYFYAMARAIPDATEAAAQIGAQMREGFAVKIPLPSGEGGTHRAAMGG
jgi:acetyl esterase/lipase